VRSEAEVWLLFFCPRSSLFFPLFSRRQAGLLLGVSLKDRYQIEEELGRGGMAVVYRARDAVLQRDVAVKVLHAHLADRKVARQRLRREALAVAKLSQDNILKVYDFSGEDENGPAFLVTEYVRGTTLRALLDEHKDLPCEVAAMMGVVLAEALSHAHQAGIIHRDIKPENVMYRTDDGALKLMDFGIAKLFEEKELTLTGGLLGSPAHMAPEVIEGKPADARSDLFSLGTLLYLFATGDYPFWAQNPHALLRQISQGKFKDPENVRPAVGRKLSGIIKKSMSLDPEARYQSADSMAKELRTFLSELGIDEPHSALCAVLRDPENEGKKLQDKVVAALLVRAKNASKQGRKGEVLAHLNRILGYEPENQTAKELLSSLNKSNRVAYVAGSIGAITALVAFGWGIFVLIQPPNDLMPTTLSMVPYSFAPKSLPFDPNTTQPTTKENTNTVVPDTAPSTTKSVTNPLTTIPVVTPKTNPVIVKVNPTSKPAADVKELEYSIRFTGIDYAMLSINGIEKGYVYPAGKEFKLNSSSKPYKILFDHPNYKAKFCELLVSIGDELRPNLTINGNKISVVEGKFSPGDPLKDAIVPIKVTPKNDDAEVICTELGGESCGRFTNSRGELRFTMKTTSRIAEFSLKRGEEESETRTLLVTAGEENPGITVSFGNDK
jgi:serine/threonine protein kinase